MLNINDFSQEVLDAQKQINLSLLNIPKKQLAPLNLNSYNIAKDTNNQQNIKEEVYQNDTELLNGGNPERIATEQPEIDGRNDQFENASGIFGEEVSNDSQSMETVNENGSSGLGSEGNVVESDLYELNQSKNQNQENSNNVLEGDSGEVVNDASNQLQNEALDNNLNTEFDNSSNENDTEFDLGFDFSEESFVEENQDINSTQDQEETDEDNGLGFDFSEESFVEENQEVDSVQEQEKNNEDSGLGFDFSEESFVDDNEALEDETLNALSIPKGKKSKFKANYHAIQKLKELETKLGHPISQEDKDILIKYSGWGAIPQAFYKPNGDPHKGWENESALLNSILIDDEYKQARSSTQNSHYTPAEVINFVWKAVEKLGFKGGKALEPSAGTGNFIRMMPNKFKDNVSFDAIELDSLTARIGSLIVKDDKTRFINGGFQDYNTLDNTFDLVVGNPPFGKTKLFDPSRNHLNNLSIHNYFFAKSAELLKEKGIMAMVVSSHLLDAQNATGRKELAKTSNLLSAIRLPDTAFSDTANTSVTTDLLILQKRSPDMESNADEWMDLGEVNGLTINSYYENNPQNLLGEWVDLESNFRGGSLALKSIDGQDLNEELENVLTSLPRNIIVNSSKSLGDDSKNDDNNDSDEEIGNKAIDASEDNQDLFEESYKHPNGSMFIFEDNIYQTTAYDSRVLEITKKYNSKMESVNLKELEVNKIKGMIGIAEVANELRSAQINDSIPDEDIEKLREQLNDKYDSFVKKYGYLNSRVNKSLFKEDVYSIFLLSLEKDYDAGLTSAAAKKVNMKSRKPSASKSDIFTKRTQYPYKPPENVENSKDGLVVSYSEKGEVDIDYISELTGFDEEKVIKDLKDENLIFFNPSVEKWESREKYLSGNVKEKYKQTKDPYNLSALKEVFPEKVDAIDIKVQIGASWIPVDYFIDFISLVSGQKDKNAISAKYFDSSSFWEIDTTSTLEARLNYGTGRRTPVQLIESLMNNKIIQVMDTFTQADGSKRQVLNEKETNLALEKAEKITRLWSDWLYQDADRREVIEEIYNDTFNVNAVSEFDGSHLKFIGKVSDDIFQLRPHQKNAVWRYLQGNPTLFDHTVGTGKTATTIAAVMESKRIGKSKKPMIVVPNHLIQQWATEFLTLYPNANILAPDQNDFQKKRRKLLMNKIMTGDYDAVIIGHSQLIKIENDTETERNIIQNELDLLEDVIFGSDKDYTVKRAEAKKEQLEEKLDYLLNSKDRDDGFDFSSLGIDSLFVDEAHEFKNLQYQTGMSSVAGLGTPTGSKKAFDLFVKTRTILENTGGKNLAFLTATPISNSIAEMFTMQRYLSYDELARKGVDNFDSWVNTFAEVVSDWELSATGEYKLKSRLAKFNNLPELIADYKQFADVVTNSDINKQLEKIGQKLPVPKMRGGAPINIIAERSEDQALYIGKEESTGSYTPGSLIERATNKTDIMLKIISEARKCALDMRLIDNSYEDFERSKVNLCVENAFKEYEASMDDKGTQLIFCDLSTPKASKTKEKEIIQGLIDKVENSEDDEEREKAYEALNKYSVDDIHAIMSSFSVYDDIKQKLINKGVPEHEIEFIHNANTDLKKQRLFEKVNAGEIRFLLGSTIKMGAGTNVQNLIVAWHHLDAPWRSSDLEQRDGRGLRQGNSLYEKYGDDFEVANFRYATKATLDSMMWQIIENKALFIEEIRKGVCNDRVVEDLAGSALSASEMKAASSGNPLILKEIKLKQEIKKLTQLKEGFLREKYATESKLRAFNEFFNRYEKTKTKLESDLKTFEEHGFSSMADFYGEINGVIYERKEDEKAEKDNSGIDNDLMDELIESVNQKADKSKGKGIKGKVHKESPRVLFGKEITSEVMKLDDTEEAEIGNFCGFKMSVFRDKSRTIFGRDGVSIGDIVLKNEGRTYITHIYENLTPILLSQRMLGSLTHIKDDLAKLNRDNDEYKRVLPILIEFSEKEFEENQRLEDIIIEHDEVMECLKNPSKQSDDDGNELQKQQA